ncbi:FxsA family protein [Thiohalomonas denitrificans]|uniref:FxsA family protein n=1 Tax=Thiohalomonas denitrificans TaxID=415747 RepID=UPI0026F257C8|nr:FxsA family protein [Thiohalomonas denitrificans]
MFRILFLLFLSIPLIEIYILIKVGSALGAPLTIFLVVFTAALGALLLRFQGIYTLQRARMAINRGELPTIAMLEGVVLVIAGALLLTPGFFTDAIGFLALVPPLRRKLIWKIIERGMFGPPGSGPDHRERGPRTIEGDFRRDD